MNLTFFPRFFLNFRRRARLSIALLFGSCLLCSGLVASANDATQEAIYDQCQYISQVLDSINSDNLQIRRAIDGTAYTHNNVSQGAKSFHQILLEILSAVQTNTPSVSVSTTVNPLAGNPWWATNSSFSPVWELYTGRYPSPATYPTSFPEIYSMYISSIMRYDSSLMWEDNVDLFGTGTQNYQENLYTWFDWVSDAFKSNWTLQVSPSYRSMTSEVDRAYAGSDSDWTPTNTPLPDYVDFVGSSSGLDVSDAVSSAENSMETVVQTLSDSISGSYSDEILLFPEFTLGGIHVPATYARLGTSIVPICHSVAVFLWGVALFASLYGLASAEFAFYVNLGRNWTTSGGFHETRGA